MNATVLKVCCAGLLALGMGACASNKGHDRAAHADEHAGEHQCAECARGESGDEVWCADCKTGFVGGKKVKCAGCYAAKTGGPACEACSSK